MLPGRKYTVAVVFGILNRYKWLILVPWVTISIGTVLVSQALPDRYRAESLIQVVPQRVPTNFVKSTITDRIEDRLPAITQQILSRTRLERTIQDFGLYVEERRTMLMEDIVRQMRDDIDVSVVKGDAFKVTYESTDARTAMKVTERLASMFVEENLRDREVQAEGANQFLDSQLDDARRRLLDHEQKLEAYRRQHAGELPTQLQANLQSIQSAQNQITQLSESINRDRDQRITKERQLVELGAEVNPADDVVTPAVAEIAAARPGPAAIQLEQGRQELAAARLRLKDNHPDIKRMERAIAQLERKAEAEALAQPVSEVTAAAPTGLSPEQQRIAAEQQQRRRRINDLRLEIESLDRQVNAKATQQKQLQAQVMEYSRRVEATPTRESELIALTRDYDTIQGLYQSLLTKSEDAKIAANMERRQIGEQFKVVDAARLPEQPFSPNRKAINTSGFAIGLALGMAIVVLLEYRDSSFRSDDDVYVVLALPVLATVPAMLTVRERRVQFKRKLMLAAAGIFVVMAGTAGAVAWRIGLFAQLKALL